MRQLIASVALLVSTVLAVAGEAVPRVSLLVASPGTEIYELEGHAGLRIVDGDGHDHTVNWGLFDFNSPGFVYRFVKGETDYRAGECPTDYFIRSYAFQGRGVKEIPLNLTPQQVEKVKTLVRENLRPENRVYRYNYVKDNCSTRPLKIVECAIGDSILLPVPAEFAGKQASFRDVMRRCHREYPWYQFGIDLALGSGIDYPLSSREFAFAPVLLPEMLAGAETVRSGEVIAGEPIVLWPEFKQSASESTPWYMTPLAAGLLLLLIAAIMTVRDVRRGKVSRWFDCALFSLYGLMGCVLAFLVFVSVHEATSPNWLLAWLNPLCFIGAWLVWLKCCRKMVLCYHFVNFAVLITLAMSWPWLVQVGNIAFVPLIAADVMRSLSYVYINRCTVKKPA